MAFNAKWTEESLDDLNILDRALIRRVILKVAWFEKHFELVTPEPLSAQLRGYYKLRIGDYRIVYRLERKSIIIEAVRHRSRVYRGQ